MRLGFPTAANHLISAVHLGLMHTHTMADHRAHPLDRHPHDGASHGEHEQHSHPASNVTDPVCGMSVDPHTTAHRHGHAGRTYYFCAESCRAKFAANPKAYLGNAPRTEIPEDAVYTCPMHPEIRQIGPGVCPICGMALEPAIALDDGPNPELTDMTRRLWAGLALALPV